jgi:hypothetical protein
MLRRQNHRDPVTLENTRKTNYIYYSTFRKTSYNADIYKIVPWTSRIVVFTDSLSNTRQSDEKTLLLLLHGERERSVRGAQSTVMINVRFTE